MPTKEEIQKIIADHLSQNNVSGHTVAGFASCALLALFSPPGYVLLPDFLKSKLEGIKIDNYAIENYVRKHCEDQDITSSELCRKANITRNTWSKICNMGRTGYKPSKNTLIQLAMALKLSLEETQALLRLGGYSFSPEDKFDKIIAICIDNKYHDIDGVNELLEEQTNRSLFN